MPCDKYIFHFTLQVQSSTLVVQHSLKIQHQWLLTCCLEKVHSHLLHNPTAVQPHPHDFHGKPTGNHKQARCLSFNSSCMIKTCCDSRKIHLVHDGSLGHHALSSPSVPFLQLGDSRKCLFSTHKSEYNTRLVLPCAQYSGLRYDHRVMKKKMLALKNQFDERKQDWLEQKFRLWRLQIQAEPLFLLPDQEEDKRRLCLQGAGLEKVPSGTSRFSSRASNS